MLTISDVIRTKFSHILDAKSTYDANEALREVAKDHGLGVAILVAWQHGLCKPHRHIDPWGLEPRPAEEDRTHICSCMCPRASTGAIRAC